MYASETAINQFIDVTATTRDIARGYLEAHNDLDVAVSDFFERGGMPKPPPPQPMDWAQQGQSSQMEHMPPGGLHSLAMSRPPSRIGREYDNEQTMGVLEGQNGGDLDDDLQKAMQMSLEDQSSAATVGSSCSLDDVKSGSVDGDAKMLDSERNVSTSLPNTLRQHEAAIRSEAVIESSRSGHAPWRAPSQNAPRSGFEIVDPSWLGTAAPAQTTDLVVQSRQRAPESPAFMKPLPTRSLFDLLPSLITILHSIPYCRQELLSVHDKLEDYGHNPNRWSGDTNSGGLGTVNMVTESEPQLDVLHETQRLMAFLDDTKRLYGSVGVLVRMLSTRVVPSDDPRCSGLDDYVHVWEGTAYSEASQTPRSRSTMFESSCTRLEPKKTIHSCRIAIHLPWCQLPKESQLYDALDLLYLGPKAYLFDDCPPVQLISLQGNNVPEQKVSVPELLYLDRYLTVNEAAMRDVAQERQAIDQRMRALRDEEAALGTYNQQKSSGMVGRSGPEVLNATIKFLRSRDALMRGEEIDGDGQRLFQTEGLLDYLTQANDRIQDKLKDLADQQKACEERLSALRKRFTDPTDPSQELKQPYQLRGVAIAGTNASGRRFSRTFFNAKSNAWEAYYDGAPSASVRIVSDLRDILEAASMLQGETLLVYVREDVLPEKGVVEVPESLTEFVARDNEAFARELAEANTFTAWDANPYGQTTYDPPSYPPPKTSSDYDNGHNGDTEYRSIFNPEQGNEEISAFEQQQQNKQQPTASSGTSTPFAMDLDSQPTEEVIQYNEVERATPEPSTPSETQKVLSPGKRKNTSPPYDADSMPAELEGSGVAEMGTASRPTSPISKRTSR